jgi:BASS family bile acid:Na+ symporter
VSLQTLILLGVNLSIFFTVLTLGMGASAAELGHLLREPRRLTRSLLVLNVAAPAIAIAVCKAIPLHPAVIAALVTLSVSPVNNLFLHDILPLLAAGRASYAYGLFFASTVLSVLLTPLAVEVIELIFGGNAHVNPLSVVQVILGTVLLPLGVGLAIGRRRPASRRWIPSIQKVSMLVLLVCGVVIIAGAWGLMASVIRRGTLTAIVVVTLLDLAAGHLLGGRDEDARTTLAYATVSRHPGVAIALASLTDQRLAAVGVLVAFLVSTLALVPYALWRKRRRERGPPLVGPPARVEA